MTRDEGTGKRGVTLKRNVIISFLNSFELFPTIRIRLVT